ncbi:hypothetical protein ElyMa_004508400 [Elysia marginata]|uniref:Uncharacterized protein n=1 Tax=Elysia marginata TaxID=1093978 RepID=A0AAV4HM54_9GAST|nr:hypothetical protein ElyMa_004508400 [Elysia marginata]
MAFNALPCYLDWNPDLHHHHCPANQNAVSAVKTVWKILLIDCQGRHSQGSNPDPLGQRANCLPLEQNFTAFLSEKACKRTRIKSMAYYSPGLLQQPEKYGPLLDWLLTGH